MRRGVGREVHAREVHGAVAEVGCQQVDCWIRHARGGWAPSSMCQEMALETRSRVDYGCSARMALALRYTFITIGTCGHGDI